MRPGDLTCILTIAFLRVCKDGVDNKKKKDEKTTREPLVLVGGGERSSAPLLTKGI